MKISKSNLLTALAIVKPGLASKELLEQTTSFAFTQGRVVTYNDEISVSHPVSGIDFEGAINAKELYGLLSKIDKDEIELTVSETELLIQAGRVKAGLKLELEVKLPIKEIPKKMEKISNPKRFLYLLHFAMQTCSKDPAQSKLSCISLKKNGLIESSDGYRLFQGQGDPLPVMSFLLPSSSTFEIVKSEPTHLSLEKGWVHFKNENGTVFSSRRIEDDYMPEDQIKSVLAFNKIGQIDFPAKINQILERVGLFAKGDTLDELVEINIDKGKMMLRAQAEGTGSWVEEKATISFDGTLSFLMTPSLFVDILQVVQTSIIDKSIQKIKFAGPDWEYVIMLRQPPEQKKTKTKKKEIVEDGDDTAF
jgi:DNA polymerase III sliding clamp (beta) subunit (PCNA family)